MDRSTNEHWHLCSLGGIKAFLNYRRGRIFICSHTMRCTTQWNWYSLCLTRLWRSRGGHAWGLQIPVATRSIAATNSPAVQKGLFPADRKVVDTTPETEKQGQLRHFYFISASQTYKSMGWAGMCGWEKLLYIQWDPEATNFSSMCRWLAFIGASLGLVVLL